MGGAVETGFLEVAPPDRRGTRECAGGGGGEPVDQRGALGAREREKSPRRRDLAGTG